MLKETQLVETKAANEQQVSYHWQQMLALGSVIPAFFSSPVRAAQPSFEVLP